MAKTRISEVTTMSGAMMRYQNLELVEHLAHQYVLGTQSLLVRKRIARLRIQYPQLDERIYFWEQKLSVLHDNTPDLPPTPANWNNIKNRLGINDIKSNSKNWLAGTRIYQLLSGFSIAAMAVMFVLLSPLKNNDPLSYIAVMNDNQQHPQLVAATYGKSRMLQIELLSIPQIPNDMSLELWVTSKTDKQARSLGVLSTNNKLINRQLTEAEWRLIKDSQDLLLTVEEKGGSPMGEPMGELIAKGLCIRMAAWQDEA